MCKKYLIGGINSQEFSDLKEILTDLGFNQIQENKSLFYHGGLGYVEIGEHNDIRGTLHLAYYHQRDQSTDTNIESIDVSINNLKNVLEKDLKPFKKENLEGKSESPK
ncbi:hypothetical protein J4465_01530 [Candidatus Pacearchaeota archaeon]|nr:hypothetical protein [Candidatus Pacearchaeota archaeon]